MIASIRGASRSQPAAQLAAGAAIGFVAARATFARTAIAALVLVAPWAMAGAACAAASRFAATDWTLRAADGQEVSLHSGLAKGPVLVSFWALWCNPCLRELPHLDAIAKETAGRLTVLAVNEDGPRSVARVRPYLRSKGIGLTVPLDTAGDVARRLQVGGTLPCVLLFDAQGREVYRSFGYREGGEVTLREKVMSVLEGARPDSAATP